VLARLTMSVKALDVIAATLVTIRERLIAAGVTQPSHDFNKSVTIQHGRETV
jgi:hypothetical protein